MQHVRGRGGLFCPFRKYFAIMDAQLLAPPLSLERSRALTGLRGDGARLWEEGLCNSGWGHSCSRSCRFAQFANPAQPLFSVSPFS